MALTTDQQAIAQIIINVGRSRGASEKQIQAALLAGYVESRFRNLSYGDRDSLGVFQQRPSQGWGTPSQVTDVTYAANAFFDAASRVNDSGMTAGQLAQAVQRSAFPARYDQASGILSQILGAAASNPIPSLVPDLPPVQTPFGAINPLWIAGALALYLLVK